MAEVTPTSTKQVEDPGKAAREKSTQEFNERMKGKPTPTQEENDRAALGEHITQHEPDGSPEEETVRLTPTGHRQEQSQGQSNPAGRTEQNKAEQNKAEQSRNSVARAQDDEDVLTKRIPAARVQHGRDNRELNAPRLMRDRGVFYLAADGGELLADNLLAQVHDMRQHRPQFVALPLDLVCGLNHHQSFATLVVQR